MHQFEDKRIDVTITWKKPIDIDEVRYLEEEKCKDTYFYKIVGCYRENYKLFYIGKCVDQFITTRIFQRDHLDKQADFKDSHKRHALMVSLGNLSETHNLKNDELANVESLLIYSHTHNDFSYMKNKQCKLNHNVIKNYKIVNKGWRQEGMYQIISYGLFVKG
jgi:hypothetical protein